MKIGIRIEDFAPETEPRVALPYPKIREIAQIAESGGLDSIWHPDHFFYRFKPNVTEGPWECWTMLSALAECTKRVELGTLVLCNPFRNPALLAKMAHTLDEISDGRLILGVGTGWHQPDFDAIGYPFDKLVDRFEEALQILQPLLKGKSVDFVGKYYQAKDCVITPLGPRPEGIPLLIGAGGPRMMRLTARYGDMWNRAWLGDPQTYAGFLEDMQNACNEVGRDSNSLGMTASVSIAFPDLGKTRPFTDEPLSGTPDFLAEAFKRYAELGTSHLIIQFTPSTFQALEQLVEAVNIYRKIA